MYINKNDTEVIPENISNNYINASYISGPLPNDTKLFIACQGPLNITIEYFWKMIMLKNIKLIVMLSNLQEEGRKKCDIYWPINSECPIILNKFKIILENEEFILDKAVIQRNIVIINEEENITYNVTQLHVVCWPDHSVPEEEAGYKAIDLIISFVDDFNNCFKDSPVVIHCR